MPRAEAVSRAKEIAQRVLAPHAQRWDREGAWPVEGVRALQEAGLAGLVVSKEHGGLGLGLGGLLEVCEALGHADASTALCFGMHCVASACIAAKATPDQAERYLGPICRGEHWTTLALSEPGTGSHFYLPQTSMREVGGAYRLHGEKCFVTSGGHADSYVVSTVASDATLGHFSLVLVSAGSVSDAWGPEWSGWGMRGNSSRALALRDVPVPTEDRLGAEGDQIWYAFQIVAPYFLIAMAGTYLGVASRAVEEARAHLTRRTHSHTGESLAHTDVLQHRIGTVWSNLQRARHLARWAADHADADGADALPALCAAKAEVATSAVTIVNECMTLVGGIGYRDDAVLPRLLRDARAAHVMSPTTDLLYTWAGRALLDLPILGR
ncbi:MAG: acyl-CoA dehydrogenase family protein [Sandaracinaceae bacterium]